MLNEEKKAKVSVIVSEGATPKQRELANWLVSALAEMEVEAQIVEEDHHEGKPKAPLLECEEVPPKLVLEPKSEEEPPEEEDWDEDDWDIDLEEGDPDKACTYGFLVGLFTAWLVIGAGVVLFHSMRNFLLWFSNLTDIPCDALIGLILLVTLASLFHRKVREKLLQLTDKIKF